MSAHPEHPARNPALDVRAQAPPPASAPLRRLPSHNLRAILAPWTWLQTHTFAPLWLPARWRHPLVGYLLAVLIELLAVILTLQLDHLLPAFAVQGTLTILGIVVVALTWGAGPSLLAVLVGTALLKCVVVPAYMPGMLNGPVDGLCVAVGLVTASTISLIASQSAWARRQAQYQSQQLAEAHATSTLESQRLRTVLEVLPSAVVIADAHGQLLEANAALKALWGQEAPLLHDTSEYGVYKGWWPESGKRIAAEEWAMARALQTGEVCPGEEVEIETFAGQRKTILNAAAPIYNEAGAIVGGVVAEMDITERKQLEDALRQANAQMDTFLGMAAHELKTPLTSLILGLQLAERRIQQAVQREETLAATAPLLAQVVGAERQAERLNRLVNDLVDVSRIQAGKLELHPEPANLVAIICAAVEEQRQAAPARTLAVQGATDQCVPVTADADRIGQVVTNYLTNALKYSPEDRPIAVGITLDRQTARVWVRDAGPGLPPEEQKAIWERFHRAKGVEAQSGSGIGLGLGLHICRTIIEWHQGQVGVESAPGTGSTFWFSLPLEGPEPPDCMRR
ncbi:MAG TPA: ATP-binding protein [Ktedonobacterales bacterium]